MRFTALPVHGLEDVTLDFEQLQSAFGFPAYPAAPSSPQPGQAYFDTTLQQIGVWTGTVWSYGVTAPLTAPGWIAPTLLSSWVLNGGAVGYLRDPLGFVHLKGRVTGGANASPIFVLPSGYRPSTANHDLYPAAGSTAAAVAAAAFLSISNISGTVVVFYETGVVDIGFGGISFLAEN